MKAIKIILFGIFFISVATAIMPLFPEAALIILAIGIIIALTGFIPGDKKHNDLTESVENKNNETGAEKDKQSEKNEDTVTEKAMPQEEQKKDE